MAAYRFASLVHSPRAFIFVLVLMSCHLFSCCLRMFEEPGFWMILVLGSSSQAVLHLLHAAQWLAGARGTAPGNLNGEGSGAVTGTSQPSKSHVLKSLFFSDFHWQLALRPAFPHFPMFLVLSPALQHLCVNLFHLMDALDLEGVPDLEMSSEPQNFGWSWLQKVFKRPHVRTWDDPHDQPHFPLRSRGAVEMHQGRPYSLHLLPRHWHWLEQRWGPRPSWQWRLGLVGLVGLALTHTISKKPRLAIRGQVSRFTKRQYCDISWQLQRPTCDWRYPNSTCMPHHKRVSRSCI